MFSAYPENSETIDNFCQTEVSDFDDRWIVFGEKNVLRLEITVGDALIVDVLYKYALSTKYMDLRNTENQIEATYSQGIAYLISDMLCSWFLYRRVTKLAHI
jgi:hypothetical protein